MFPAIFIDKTPYPKPHTVVEIAPVLTKDMDEAVVRRAQQICPKHGRLFHLPREGLIGWKEYDRDKMALSFFRYEGDDREMPGYREWCRLEMVWAKIDGTKQRLWAFVERSYGRQNKAKP